MKRKTMVLGMGMLAVSLLVVGCAKKYADVETAMGEVAELMETFTVEAGKVDSPESAAKAINAFADGMESMKPRLDALDAKYPELEDQENPPEELKEMQVQLEKIAQEMGNAMMKMTPYMQVPNVMEALQRLQALEQ